MTDMREKIATALRQEGCSGLPTKSQVDAVMETISAEAARVRAELADEADRRAKTHVVEGCDWYARDALLEFAEDIRAGRLVAGSSPDTTPEPKP